MRSTALKILSRFRYASGVVAFENKLHNLILFCHDVFRELGNTKPIFFFSEGFFKRKRERKNAGLIPLRSLADFEALLEIRPVCVCRAQVVIFCKQIIHPLVVDLQVRQS